MVGDAKYSTGNATPGTDRDPTGVGAPSIDQLLTDEVPAGPHGGARRFAALLWHFDRARRTFEQRATLGVADMRMLWLFSDGNPRTLRDVAERLELDQSTVNRQVNAAVTAGLLTRSDDAGGRPYRFTISPTGTRELDTNLDAIFEIYRGALAALGPDRDRFLAGLATFVDAYVAGVEPSTNPTSNSTTRPAGSASGRTGARVGSSAPHTAMP